MRTIVSAVTLLALAACASNPQSQQGPGGPGGRPGGLNPSATPAPGQNNATARADIHDADGRSLGVLTLTQTPHGVLVVGDLTGLPAGIHALHVHESGRCEAPFTSAGGHLNLAPHTHGVKSAQGPHNGDLANFNAPASGPAHIEQISRDLTMATGPVGMFDADGASLVVHQGADDYSSDPAGNAGPRIACGPITR